MTPASAPPLSAILAAIRSALRLRRTETPSRFRTEISFRRHNELPRASALPAERDDHATTAWQSPEPVEHDVIEDALVEETPAAEKSTPFLRREITFRRKKTVDDAPVAAEHDLDDEITHAAEEHEIEPAEVVAHAYEPVAEPEVVASLAFGADDSAAVDGDVVAEPAIAGTVPFYKRELGFRRKKAGAVEAVAFAATDIDLTDDEVDLREPAAEPELVGQNIELDLVEEIVEPVAAATVPFYKRDLSFSPQEDGRGGGDGRRCRRRSTRDFR